MSEKVEIKLSATGQGQVVAAFNQIKSGAASLGASVRSLLVPLAALGGAAAGFTAVSSGIKSIIDQGGKLNDLSIRTGVGVRALVRWREVFEESGKSADSIGPAFDKVSRSIYTAATAGGAGELAFAKLGLSAKALSALSPEEQFETLAKAINGVENQSQRAAITMQIFGKSAGDLLPVFDTMKNLVSVDGALGRLPEILARNVGTLDAIGDSFTQLKLKSQQFFAGIMDQVGGPLKELLDSVTTIDLTKLGQNVGAFVNVAIDAWKQGRFGDLVSLSIEAGFEQGSNAARGTFKTLSEYLGSKALWGGVGLGLLTSINEAMKLAVDGVGWLQSAFVAVADYTKDQFVFAFKFALEMFGKGLEVIINSAIDLINKRLGTSIASFKATSNLTLVAPDGARSLANAQASQAANPLSVALKAFFDNSTESARSLLGGSGLSGGSLDATNRLVQLVDEMKEKREAEAVAAALVIPPLKNALVITSAIADTREEELATLRRLRILEDQRAVVAGSYAISEANKYRANLALLTAQRLELERMVALLRTQAALPGLTDQERTQISQRADSFDARLSGVNKNIGALPADPNSVREQMISATVDLQNQFGTLAQGIATTFKNTIGTAVDSISNGISGLILRTKTWSQALREVGTSILTAVVNSVVKMGVQWAIGFALQKTLGALSVKTATAQATQVAASWGAAATAASIATLGSAAIVGTASAIAGIVAGSAAAAGVSSMGFRSGGYTGSGPADQVAGYVHRDEYVMNASTVQRVGLPALEAVQSGAAPASAPGGSNFRIATFDSRVDAKRWADSEDGETWWLDMANKTAHRLRRS